MTPRTRVLTNWMPSWLVSGRRMKTVSYSRLVPGSSRIDIAMSFSSRVCPRRAGARLNRVLLGTLVELVHREGGALLDQRLDGVGGVGDHRPKLLLLRFGEGAEHVADHPLLVSRMPDADAHAQKRRPQVLADRSNAVVSSVSSSDFHFQAPELEVDVVVDDDDVARLDLEEGSRRLHLLARHVHVAQRPERNHLA